MPMIEGAYGMAVFAGAPVNGVDEVQSSVISGGPPTTLTFQLAFQGSTSAAITWSNVNATLLNNINTALNAMPTVGTSGVVASAGAAPALTSGIGQVLYTFSGVNLGKKNQPLMTVVNVVQTGTATTVGAITESTAGVDATLRGHLGPIWDTVGKKMYANHGTGLTPIWVVLGTET